MYTQNLNVRVHYGCACLFCWVCDIFFFFYYHLTDNVRWKSVHRSHRIEIVHALNDFIDSVWKKKRARGRELWRLIQFSMGCWRTGRVVWRPKVRSCKYQAICVVCVTQSSFVSLETHIASAICHSLLKRARTQMKNVKVQIDNDEQRPWIHYHSRSL